MKPAFGWDEVKSSEEATSSTALSSDAKLAVVREGIAEALDAIKGLFKDPVYVTLVVRNPHREQANVVMTDDPQSDGIVNPQFLTTCPIEIPPDEEVPIVSATEEGEAAL